MEATHIDIATPQAGGHPNLKTSFAIENPGAPEAAKNITFNAPTGVFGNPRSITQCVLANFALDECPPNSQAGLITIRADYKGNPDYLLGTAPLFSIAPEEGETARFSFIVPILNIPISIPVTVRTTTDYGLRFTVSDITEVAPLAEAKLTFWGFPAEKIHDAERFPIGSAGNPTNCAEEEGTGCIATPTSDSIVPQPLIDNPTNCTGQEPTSLLEVQTYGDPTHPSEATATYPPIEGCQREVFKPVLHANPTTTDTDSASGLDVDLSSPSSSPSPRSPPRSRPPRSPFRKASRSTPTRPTARPLALTCRPNSTPKDRLNAPINQRSGPSQSALRRYPNGSKVRYTSANRSLATSIASFLPPRVSG